MTVECLSILETVRPHLDTAGLDKRMEEGAQSKKTQNYCHDQKPASVTPKKMHQLGRSRE